MACPKCGCKTVYQFDDEDDPQDDRMQRCAACGEIFDLDDHADEDEDERAQADTPDEPSCADQQNGPLRPEWFYELDRCVLSDDPHTGAESFQFYFDEHEFSIEREAFDRNWYITVSSERGYAYNGYWRDSASKDLVAAIVEAFHGSMIPLPAARNDADLPDLADIERQPWPLPPAFEPLPVQPGTREALEREHQRRNKE